jgi:hypothetical protein
VIPLPRMGEYTDWHRAHQHRAQPAQQAAAGGRAAGLLRARQRCRWASTDDAGEIPSAELLEDRVQQALALLARCARCGSSGCTTGRGRPAEGEAAAPASSSCRTTACAPAGSADPQAPAALFRRRLRAGPRRVPRIHQEVLRGRVWVALHMHAGDGNVHTNIPVNSDNYEMLQTAHEAVAASWRWRAALDGVISGRARHRHHQARVPDRRRDWPAFTDYKRASTPRAASTRASCCAAPAPPPWERLGWTRCMRRPERNAYTPSFGLMGHESLIMQQSDIGAIADSGQGLPALRQVQAGVRHPRAARQPAVQPAQQDPGHLAADRGLPVRGADAPRRQPASTGRSSRTWPTTARCATSASPPAR